MTQLTYLNLAALCCTAVLYFNTVSGAETDWGYSDRNGPDTWCELVTPKCCGTSQSPVDIVDEVEADVDKPIVFKDYIQPYDWLFQNNGHTLYWKIDGTTFPGISGGPLKDKYTFSNLHIHLKSEHTLHGQQFAGELHFVHYLTSAGSMKNALLEPDGVAVLAVFLEEWGHPHDQEFEHFMSYYEREVELKGDSIAIPNRELLDSFLPDFTGCYYSYQGSLTTPMCNQAVRWIVFDEPLHVSARLMARLRANIKTTDQGATVALFPNTRPVQPINDRTITAYGCT